MEEESLKYLPSHLYYLVEALHELLEPSCKFPDCTYLRNAGMVIKYKQVLEQGGLLTDNQLHNHQGRQTSCVESQKLQKISSCMHSLNLPWKSTNTWNLLT